MDAFHQWSLGGESIFAEPPADFYHPPLYQHQRPEPLHYLPSPHPTYIPHPPLSNLLLHPPQPQSLQHPSSSAVVSAGLSAGRRGLSKRATAPVPGSGRVRLDPGSRRLHQRRAANQRERKRMRSINAAFDGLRKRLPIEQSEERKLSKVETLKYAIQYIQNLADVLSALEESEAKANPNYKKKAKIILLCQPLLQHAPQCSSAWLDNSSGSAHSFETDATASEFDEEAATEAVRDDDGAYKAGDSDALTDLQRPPRLPSPPVWGHALSWRDDRVLMDPEWRIRCPTLDSSGEEDEGCVGEEGEAADGGHNNPRQRRQQQPQQRRCRRRVRAATWTPTVTVSGVWYIGGGGNDCDVGDGGDFDSLPL